MTLRNMSRRFARLVPRNLPIMFVATSFVVLVCVSLVSVEVWLTWRARDIQLQESAVSTANLAEAVAQHAYDTIKEADTVLIGLVERLEREPAAQLDLDRIHRLLGHRVAELPQLHGLFVYDENGGWLVNSQPILLKNQNNSDREYFKFHRDHPDLGVHIGPPVRSKSTGVWIVTVSRRFNQPDGKFGGVVLATINMKYFNEFFGRFNIGRDGAIFLALDNGTMLVRRPFSEKSLGRDISKLPLFREYLPKAPAGTHTYTSGQDGVTRINSYRRLAQYPLVVSAALSEDEILARWRADASVNGAAVAILTLGIALLGFRLVRQIQLRVQAETELVNARSSLEMLNKALEKLAMQDGLTGLANRRQFDVSLNIEFARAMRNASSLALIMIDVDCFKQYNDTYGHAAGDECLKAIGKALRDTPRRTGDLAARYGGEELAVLLPGADVAGALNVAEKIRAAVESLQLTHIANGKGIVTVSAGVHAVEPQGANGAAIDLVVAADKALYQAKANGRNRVCSLTSNVALPLQAVAGPGVPCVMDEAQLHL
jgi:diguanylate cyclase (GGDEF)-like protein